ncbi:MAG: 16S rRNA methyltransferase [Archaeoglobaceae archaeon]|nr:16S rRNA methyltransferase [Archaeoglobaceae archaeon]MCX8152016.1 16S rRNA methyltransferase [Archaeoglobaceae archaeon]MDW8013405.1 16S rRNA methyltransferase [Archaeoglobaceae archaeon]
MKVVFLEASIELVPEVIADHPAILADARRRRKSSKEILLDDSKHHSAMKKLKDWKKRGRPDIIHSCLLLLLDSPFSKDLEIYVHTVEDKIIKLNPKVRLPRNYNRFVGLMEDLMKKGKIEVDREVLVEIVDEKLEEIIDGKVLVFHEKGESLKENILDYSTVCIGAFPHGDFSEKTMKALKGAKFVSLGLESYTSLYVTCKFLSFYEGVRINRSC